MPRKKAEKSGDVVPQWVEIKPSECVEAIINLANQGHSASEIGMMLRDQYGVPNVKALCGKRVSAILAEHKLATQIPEDMLNLIRTSVTLKHHLAEHGKDMTAKRGYQLTVSKIRRLANYYKKTGKIPLDWRYTPETAELLVK